MKAKIIILSAEGASLEIAYNCLKNNFAIENIVIERPVSKYRLLRYRVKKLGVFKVMGQLAFMLYTRWLNIVSQERRQKIIAQNGIEMLPAPKEIIQRVESVNSEECRTILRASTADFILVNGTRIIGKKTLQATNIKFVNIHAGITPKYRGVHGGYWALSNQDEANCGTTVHYVDTGIDTGAIIAQKQITPTAKDNFTTYPLLQQIEGLSLLLKATTDILSNKAGYERTDLPSEQYFHPTLMGYWFRRIKFGVK